MSLVISGGQTPMPMPQPDPGAGSVPAVPAAASPPQPAAAGNAQPSNAQIQKALANLQQAAAMAPQNVEFSVDQSTGRTIIKVVDSANGQVVRQIPSEQILQMAQELDKLSGLLLKEKA